MRNPRISIQKVPGHKAVGQKVARVLERFLDVHPDLEYRFIDSVGASKETARPPKRRELKKCYRWLAEAFEVDRDYFIKDDGEGETQMNHLLID